MNHAGFPSLASLFQAHESSTVSLCLKLLGLSPGDGSREAIRAVQAAVASSPDRRAEVTALLSEVNWRPQLVGAVAILIGAADDTTLDALWQAFDSGSWVSPQLAVTAFMTDPSFEANARSRVEAGCPIKRDHLATLDWATRHSAAGPSSFADHSGKALAALVYLCRELTTAKPWLDAAAASETVQKALTDDRDGGDRIAARWWGNVRTVLHQRS